MARKQQSSKTKQCVAKFRWACLALVVLSSGASAKFLSSTATQLTRNHTSPFNQSSAGQHTRKTGASPGQAPASSQPGTTPLLSPWQAFQMAQHNPAWAPVATDLLLHAGAGPDAAAAGGAAWHSPDPTSTSSSLTTAAQQTDDGDNEQQQQQQQATTFESLFGLKLQDGLDDPTVLLSGAITVNSQLAAVGSRNDSSAGAGAAAGSRNDSSAGAAAAAADRNDSSAGAAAAVGSKNDSSAGAAAAAGGDRNDSSAGAAAATGGDRNSHTQSDPSDPSQVTPAAAPQPSKHNKETSRNETQAAPGNSGTQAQAPPPPSQRTNRTHSAPPGSRNTLLKASPALRRLRQALSAAKQRQQPLPRQQQQQPPGVAAAAANQQSAVAADQPAAAASGSPPAIAAGKRAPGSKRQTLWQSLGSTVKQQQKREQVPAPARGVVKTPQGFRTAPSSKRQQPSKLLTQRRRTKAASRH